MEPLSCAPVAVPLSSLSKALHPIPHQSAPDGVVQNLAFAPGRLLQHPRMGKRLPNFGTREVRRLIVGAYEMRYEVAGQFLKILRIWHIRKDRS